MTLSLDALGRFSVRRRGFVVIAWLLVAVAVIAGSRTSGGAFSDNLAVPGSPSQQATELLEQRFPAAAGGSAQLVFHVPDGSLGQQPAAGVVEQALREVRSLPHVANVTNVVVADDGATGIARVEYEEPTPGIRDEAFTDLTSVAERTTADGVRLELGGELPFAAETAPAGQELVGLAAAALVLLVAFGSVVAMGLPIGVALIGLSTSIGMITAAAAFTEVSDVAVVLSSMIGLGVGIDYALFIVTRYRQYLGKGFNPEHAAGRAIATAGRAVLFAGLIVVVSVLGLTIFGLPAMTTVAVLIAATVTVMVALALTLLPALLGFVGHRIDFLRVPLLAPASADPGRQTVWHRFGRRVCDRPWHWFLGTFALLLLLTSPLLDIRLGIPSVGTNAPSTTTRQAHDLTSEAFGPGSSSPIVVAVELGSDAGNGPGDGSDEVLSSLTSAILHDPGVVSVAPPTLSPDGTAAVVTATPATSPADPATSGLVERLRQDVVPAVLDGTDATGYVTGQTAFTMDQTDRIADRLLWFILAVIGLSVVVLTVIFRSIAVPLKAAVLNLLSIGAAYGMVVAVFQWGWFAGVFGVEESVPIASFVPMLMFAVLFGISMDYEVFLLSRVREEYLRHGDNDTAVVDGLASTARVITSAALIMISVFSAFVFGQDPLAKMLGLGLATAVLVDATIVRIILVPATMRLLGDRNWWMPDWLDRVLPRFSHDGEPVGRLDERPDPSPERAAVLVDASEPDREPITTSI